MSSLTDSAADLAESMLDVAWRQWSAIGGAAANDRPSQSIVDPEALVLYTLTAMRKNQRLESILYSWLEVNGELLSVQRMKNIATQFPARVTEYLAHFARAARTVAGHPKWEAFGGHAEPAPHNPIELPESRRAIRISMHENCAILLRLRLALGVGVKADVLAVLLGQRESRATVKELVGFTGYTNVAVRGALESLSEARFIDARPGRPQSYSASRERWGTLLGSSSFPSWKPWTQFYVFGIALRDLVDQAEAGGFSDYALSTKVRELIEAAPVLFAQVTDTHAVHTAAPELVAQNRIAMLREWASAG